VLNIDALAALVVHGQVHIIHGDMPDRFAFHTYNFGRGLHMDPLWFPHRRNEKKKGHN